MNQKDNGFTLIEISLVLAIAGAIFAAIFIALSGVWADERDNERRSDMMTFILQLKNYQTNNSRGALPNETLPVLVGGDSVATDRDRPKDNRIYKDTSWAGFYRDYFNESFIDPDGERYNLNVSTCTASKPDAQCPETKVPDAYTMDVITGAVCYGEAAVKSANPRNVAVLYKMEAGGVYCENT